jgi:hypothetical protein
MKISFHVHFTKPAFISHFMPIDVKGETNGHFRSLLPMKSPAKNMKRSSSKTERLISPQIGFVSRRFTFRFIPDARSFCNRRWLSVTS